MAFGAGRALSSSARNPAPNLAKDLAPGLERPNLAVIKLGANTVRSMTLH